MGSAPSDPQKPIPTVEYSSPPPDVSKPLRRGTLVGFSAPAIACIALFLVVQYQIQQHPLDETAGSNVFTYLFPIALISILTSGALILSIFESRKSFFNVFILAINLGWFAIATFILLSYRVGRHLR